MMLGSNLGTRVSLLLLGGFVVIQLVIFAALALPTSGAGTRPYNLPPPTELAAIVRAIENAPPNKTCRRAVNKVPFASDVGNTFDDLQRHDLFEDVGEFITSTELQQYPRLVTERFPPEKARATRSSKRQVDAFQRFFRFFEKV